MEGGGYTEHTEYNAYLAGIDASVYNYNNNSTSFMNKNTKYNHHKNTTSQEWQVLNSGTQPTQDASNWYHLPTTQQQHSYQDKQKSHQPPHDHNYTSVNSAFDALRGQVPTFPYEKRLSKIDTLQLTIAYINLLRDILTSNMEPVEYIQHSLMEENKEGKELEWDTSDLTARLHWVDWSKIGKI